MAHNLPQLHAELTKAGVAVPALGTDASGIHTYDDHGTIIPLPKAAAKIVKAHQPQPTQRDADLATVRASTDPAIVALVRLLGLGA
jgi:hypothetical protein